MLSSTSDLRRSTTPFVTLEIVSGSREVIARWGATENLSDPADCTASNEARGGPLLTTARESDPLVPRVKSLTFETNVPIVTISASAGVVG